MFLIMGLGNPGKKYEKSRHNVGFMAIDFLMSVYNIKKLKLNKSLKAEMLLENIFDQKIILVKPTTYMNHSGHAIQHIKNYYKLQNENIIVVYDELDLPLGEIRVKKEGSSAGHNGIKSIMEYLATDKFWRIRVGITNNKREKMPVDKFVLSNFSYFEQRKLKKIILPDVVKKMEQIINSAPH